MANTNKMSMICPKCQRLINTNEPCPYCGLSSPGSWWRKTALVQEYLKPDNIVSLLIIVNAFFFIISTLLGSTSTSLEEMNPLALFTPDNKILIMLGATGTFPINQLHRWWTLISASYLHGSIFHILFNMYAVYQIAPLVLQEYGFNRMVILYTIGGAIGFYVSYLAGVPLTIGASASLCALIGSMLYYGKTRGGSYGQLIFKQLGGWVIFMFLFGFMSSGINNWAHGGGLLGGILLGYLLGYRESKRGNYYHRIISNLCIVVTILILLWAFSSTIYYRLAQF
jgi:rhomboid protease GluP